MPTASDDVVRFLTEYPSLRSPADLAHARAAARRRSDAVKRFQASGYERDFTITTQNHRDGTHRCIDVFSVRDAGNPNAIGERLADLLLPPRTAAD